MYKANRYTYSFIISVVTVIVLNLIVVYFNCQSQKYFSENDRIFSKSVADDAQNILRSYDYDEYSKVYDELGDEYQNMNEYYILIKNYDGRKQQVSHLSKDMQDVLNSYNMSEIQTQECLEQIRYCMYRLDYALKYPDYIRQVKQNADIMKDLDIFSEDIHNNIIKTGSDFDGLEKISVSAQSDLGVKLLFSDRISDIFAVLVSVVCALFYSLRCRAEFSGNWAEKSRIALFAGILTVCIMCLYIQNIFLVDRIVEVGDLKRAVQSVTDFHSCPYVISVGTLIFLRIFFKAAACLTIYLLCTGLFSAKKKILSFSIFVIAAAAEIIMFFIDARINFPAEFRIENIIGKYGNIIAFNESISPVVPMTVSAFVLLAAAAVLAYKNISAAVIMAAKRAEKAYLDGLNDRYTEVRLMRHDIKNHLSVIAVLLAEGDTDGARKYLGEISAQLDDIKPPVKTGSSVLDALLFKKYSSAVSDGITVNINFSADFSSCRVTGYDLCSIFSNIMDNACEACRQLPVSEKKISLTVKNQMDMVCIFCENKYKQINNTGGIFNTTKPDRNSHGLGLKRITRIASKYGGDVRISTENNIFSISVLLMK